MLHNSTEHGIDISATRIDDLDREIIQFALMYKGRKVAIDLGSGEGRVSRILALLGFDVWCYDTRDLTETFLPYPSITFVQRDIRTLTKNDFPDGVVVAIIQRTLHHFPYAQAVDILRHLNTRMHGEGRLYLSVSGIASKLSEGYQSAHQRVEERYGEVGTVGKEIYAIHGNVCLYDQADLSRLLEESGYRTERVWESAFGNIKGIGTPVRESH